MRIASFNVQNMRLRDPDGAPHLDGARDADGPLDSGPGASRFDDADRWLTARVLATAEADVVALQEVFDAATLDHFHDTCLVPAGVAPYPHRVCLPGNDGRGLDVALMSRVAPLGVRSHARLTPADLGLAPPPGIDPALPVFRRDCLLAELPGITLLVCHFKAPWPDAEAARPVRRLEAEAVRRIIEARFDDPGAAPWMILGDLNAPRGPDAGPDSSLAPLGGGFAVDLLARLPEADRWSFLDPASGRYARPDALLASPSLAASWPEAVPEILRAGLGREAARYTGPRLAGTGEHRPHASDHAALVIEFPGLGAGA